MNNGLLELQNCSVSGRRGAELLWEQIVVFFGPTLLLRPPESLHSPGSKASAEEAARHIEAVHHHQSLCALCVCVCCLQVSHKALQTLEQQTNTAATTEHARFPLLFPNIPGTLFASILFASKWAECISNVVF